jgi:hypothetical protein
MNSLPNIEKSVYWQGEYVGYCYGAWRISHSASGDGSWFAYRVNRSQCRDGEPLYFRSSTLKGMSEKLEAEESISRKMPHFPNKKDGKA